MKKINKTKWSNELILAIKVVILIIANLLKFTLPGRVNDYNALAKWSPRIPLAPLSTRMPGVRQMGVIYEPNYTYSTQR